MSLARSWSAAISRAVSGGRTVAASAGSRCASAAANAASASRHAAVEEPPPARSRPPRAGARRELELRVEPGPARAPACASRKPTSRPVTARFDT